MSWRERERREREREKKMPFIVATYVYASSQGQRMNSARTKTLNLHDMHAMNFINASCKVRQVHNYFLA